MDIQLIAMDLDGTALQNDRCSFSPRLEQALLEAHRKGVAIVPVTGRQYWMLPPAVQGAPEWGNLAVLCNGGQVRKLITGELLDGLIIERSALEQLIQIAERFGIPLEFSNNSCLYLTQESYDKQLPVPRLAFHRDVILARFGKIVERLDPSLEIEKVNLLCIPDAVREEVVRLLQGLPISAVWSSADGLEITHPDATKANGLRKVCKMLGVDIKNAMSLGDSGNDLSMLSQAGLGVAMGNAPDFVKAAADVVTDDNDRDGAAVAIERYVLTR